MTCQAVVPSQLFVAVEMQSVSFCGFSHMVELEKGICLHQLCLKWPYI
jgi:hypothetical protein